MNKILIVLMFILLGSALIVVTNLKGTDTNSFNIVYINNKNISLPDLDGKTDLGNGVYRVYDLNGITIDYNTINGQYKVNGTWTGVTGALVNIDYSTQLIGHTISIKVTIISGVSPIGTYYRPSGLVDYQMTSFQGQQFSIVYSVNRDSIRMQNGAVFNDFTYIVQIEKGDIVTSYVVPKLLPMYQDNLTIEEKEKIGLGAFSGISAIIKTISDVISPIGDFINGLLSIF